MYWLLDLFFAVGGHVFLQEGLVGEFFAAIVEFADEMPLFGDWIGHDGDGGRNLFFGLGFSH